MSARRPRSSRLGHTPQPPSAARPDRPADPPAPASGTGDPSAETFAQAIERVRRERAARLRSLWQLTTSERVAAMRRGELTLEQLAAWSARHPDQVPRVNGEFEWITAHTPEASE